MNRRSGDIVWLESHHFRPSDRNNQILQSFTLGDAKLAVFKPTFRIRCEPCSQFQQSAAGEKLAGVCRIDVDADAGGGRAHGWSSTVCEGCALAA
jgi:hypothetical protein